MDASADKAASCKSLFNLKSAFYVFVSFTVLGIVTLIFGYKEVGIGLVGLGVVSGVVCSFLPCPYCSKSTGVFFKGVVGGAVPLGFCVHCGKSYLGKYKK